MRQIPHLALCSGETHGHPPCDSPLDPNSQVTDERWVDALIRGEPEAFDAVWHHYRAPLFGFLVRMTGRREVAEELVQDTFVQLHRHASRLRKDTRLKAFLFTIARNLARSHHRWGWLDGTKLAELAARALARPPGPEEWVALDATQVHIERAVASMPLNYREAFLLVVGEGLEPSEAATLLGVSPETLRQRLHRAREIVRQYLRRLDA